MERLACKDEAEVSCLVANLLAELEPPCEECEPGGGVVLTGTSPAGAPVTVRLLPECVVEVEGCEDLLGQIRERRCPHDRK